MSKSTTRRSTPKLSEIARHVVAPKGVVATGWPAVEAKCADLGVRFRPWQQPVGRLILAKRADGKYAATIGGTGLSIPRQVGKTFLVGAIVFALCLLFPNLTVIWTAHRLRMAEETFKKMQAFAQRKSVRPHILKVVLGSGEEEIRFRNGSRILFGARERGFGRGFDEVDVLIFDEAQILGENALDDMIPATNQSRQPAGALLLYMGTPPKPTDPGEVFKRMRTQALTGEDHDTGWVEFGADADYRPPPLPAPLTDADWRHVAKANPSFPNDTPHESILRMRKNLGDDAYLREGLGIWDMEQAELALPSWPDLAVRDDDRPVAPAFAVETTQDQAFTAIGVSGVRPDGRLQVEIAAYRADSTWAVAEIQRLLGTWGHGSTVVIDPRSPAGALIGDLEDAGIAVTKPTAQEVSHACASFFNDVIDKRIAHRSDPEITAALTGAKQRALSDAWSWDRKHSNVAALMAVTLAAWSARRGGGDFNIW